MRISYLISKLISKLQIPAIKNSKINESARVAPGTHLVNVTIGRYSYIGRNTAINNTDIGQFCSIAGDCKIGGSSHPLDWVSTSPVFHEGRNIMGKNFSNHPYKTTIKTTIGNDVWIGSNCLIKSGVKIMDGAVVGMGSVVTKDIGPYEIWAGNPAKLIRKRFNEVTATKLLETEWWDLDEEALYNASKSFNEINKFINETR
ncbi:CatB-related O-acetyltransferase [Fredinandcohnia onubensis]|uniref:CatB-related O-acetyltransferase n=1 Tax=Fredinandcohnia onubensis TaxID=1571209 RepID=UPI0015D4A3C4|nr:CatB-related O-acetyltransferase [Fredinandcohnia onubensis]